MMLCPNCGTVIPKIVWSLLAAFLCAPFAIVATVFLLIRRANRDQVAALPARSSSERLLP
jgi:hypothetical protein